MNSTEPNWSIQNDTIQCEPKFGLISPVDCYKLNMISVYCLLLFVVSLIINSILLRIFHLKKKYRTSFDVFMSVLTVFNLFGTLFEFPFVIVSNIYCRWMFHEIGCYISGSIMYFIGTSSIYLLIAISFERYQLTKDSKNVHFKNMKIINLKICASVLMGLFWSIVPFLGWSRYSLEGSLTTCSVEWSEKSLNVISYNISMFAFVFFVPLAMLLVININLFRMINKAKYDDVDANCKQNKRLLKRRMKREQRERKASIVLIIIIICFFISWSPYAFISLYSAFVSTVSPLASLIPSMMAKTSLVWSSLILIIANKDIRIKFSFKIFCIQNANFKYTFNNKYDMKS